jgi:hypothetical protein
MCLIRSSQTTSTGCFKYSRNTEKTRTHPLYEDLSNGDENNIEEEDDNEGDLEGHYKAHGTVVFRSMTQMTLQSSTTAHSGHTQADNARYRKDATSEGGYTNGYDVGSWSH